MFNGLIREIAQVASFDGRDLRLRAAYKPSLGDSIAVNGVCLSVTALFAGGFVVQVSSETARVVATENFTGRVHIEPAMRVGERIDGHLMQGHVDAVGVVRRIARLSTGTDIYIELPRATMALMAVKGSVAVDGVSLTINEIIDEVRQIRLTLIPITMKDTIFADFAVGRRVNIESDALARYVARQMAFWRGSGGDLAQGGDLAGGGLAGFGGADSVSGARDGGSSGLSWSEIDAIMSSY